MKEFKLSNRLSACSESVTPNSKIADIGTDHAYIPIYLGLTKKISHALACDVRSGPLENAKKNINFYNLNNIIETRLSDGLENVSENEADEIIIAGMGGNMISNILENCSWKNKESKRFILQPMKYENKLRAYLALKGYEIQNETAVICSEKVYSVMTCVFTNIPYKITPVQEYIGKITINQNFASKSYIKKQIKNLQNLEKGAKATDNIEESEKYSSIVSSLLQELKN